MSSKSTIGGNLVIILLLELVLNFIVLFFTTSILIYTYSFYNKMPKSQSKVTKRNINSQIESPKFIGKSKYCYKQRQKIKYSNREYCSVHANRLTTEKEVKDKPAFVTVNIPEYS